MRLVSTHRRQEALAKTAGRGPGQEVMLHKKVLFGLRIGLIIATVLSVWATIVRIALGPGAFERFGLSWAQIVSLYYVTLSLGGCAYGVVEPLRRYALGAILQGLLLVLPAYVGISVAIGLMLDRSPSVGSDVVLGAIIAIFVGSFVGLWIWIEEKQKTHDPQASDVSTSASEDEVSDARLEPGNGSETAPPRIH